MLREWRPPVSLLEDRDDQAPGVEAQDQARQAHRGQVWWNPRRGTSSQEAGPWGSFGRHQGPAINFGGLGLFDDRVIRGPPLPHLKPCVAIRAVDLARLPAASASAAAAASSRCWPLLEPSKLSPSSAPPPRLTTEPWASSCWRWGSAARLPTTKVTRVKGAHAADSQLWGQVELPVGPGSQNQGPKSPLEPKSPWQPRPTTVLGLGFSL